MTANYMNKKLGIKIFDESQTHILKLIKYSQKEIKELGIDHLIQDGKWTDILINIVHDIQTKNV